MGMANVAISVQTNIIINTGTKGVAKAMKKVASGAVKWDGIKWFSQLSDKCKEE